jgi:hypothetical protein
LRLNTVRLSTDEFMVFILWWGEREPKLVDTGDMTADWLLNEALILPGSGKGTYRPTNSCTVTSEKSHTESAIFQIIINVTSV